jgi:hypothetical protein
LLPQIQRSCASGSDVPRSWCSINTTRTCASAWSCAS